MTEIKRHAKKQNVFCFKIGKIKHKVFVPDDILKKFSITDFEFKLLLLLSTFNQSYLLNSISFNMNNIHKMTTEKTHTQSDIDLYTKHVEVYNLALKIKWLEKNKLDKCSTKSVQIYDKAI